MAKPSEQKFTKGPWKVSVDWSQTTGDTFSIEGSNGAKEEVIEANRRLISAAPDMAEALQAWEHWYSVDSTEFNRDMAQFKGLAALKKAGL